MQKQAKIFLRITIFLFVILFLFSQELYARALHFIAYGDTRRDIKTREKPQVKHNAIASVIRENNPDFILFSGDMVYCDEFEKFLEVITNNYTGSKMIPLYPVIGNHELIFGEKVDAVINDLLEKIGVVNKSKERSSSQPELLHDLEALKRKLYLEIESIPDAKLKTRSRQVLCEEICGKLDPAYISYLKEVLCETKDGQSWYSFVKEADGLKIKFIALNSSLPDDEEQFQWFLNELKQFSGPKIILEHYPPYSTGFHGCLDLMNKNSKASRFRDRYAKIFNNTANNVVLVVSGHEHNYQRICKTDQTGSMQLPVYVVSGGGGAELTGQAACDTSQIPMDGFRCLGLITAYQFIDIVADTDDKDNLTLTCKTLGLQCDLTEGLPDDDTFERQFVNDRLEVIDDFTLSWEKQR
ncbi:MAG: metallophosphoesterase [Planctomycetes bacterium]|uniref:metallophosphoesterase family protein n=1 Tax=Candidatus Wunengus sp. YC65 TaxID=3367701 RepID=UPI001DB27E05|nr:metallophosphoesterase [Planctomycetota bacterium]